MNHRIILLLSFLGITTFANAQWTTDTLNNTTINNAAGVNYVPKIRVTKDHNYFVSWYGGPSNLDMHLQLLDFNGNARWPQNGIVISNNTQNTSVTDYDMAVDTAGNAIIAFTDIRNGDQDVVVYKVDTAQNMLYGANGVVLNDPDNTDDYVPKITITTDNSVVVCWMHVNSNGLTTYMQKIDPSGNVLWGTNGISFSNASYQLEYPTPIATSDTGFIMVYYRQTGPVFAADRKIYAQKYNSAGQPLWQNEVELCGSSGIPGFEDLRAIPDGMDGAIAAWYDDPDGNNLQNTEVQHLWKNGTLAYSVGGKQVGGSSSENHYDIIPAGCTSDSSVIVYWTYTNSLQSMFGMKGQKVEANGNLDWGAGGKTLIPQGSIFEITEGAEVYHDTSYVMYREGSSSVNDNLMLKQLTPAGDTIGNPDVVVSIAPSQKIHFDNSAISDSGMTVQLAMVWEDVNSSTQKIKGQNFIVHKALPRTDTTSNDTTSHSGLALLARPDMISYYHGEFHIYSGEVQKIYIYDMEGRSVQNIAVNNRKELPVKDLPAGIYIAVGAQRDGNLLQTFKFYRE